MADDPDCRVRRILHYATSSLVRHLLGLVTALVRTKLLGPELYGVWTLVKSFPTYAAHLHLGAQTAMFYRIPQLEAQGAREALADTEATAFHGVLSVNLLFCLLLAAGALLSVDDPTLKYALLLACPVILLDAYYEHHINRLKGRREFARVADSHYLYALLEAAATVALVLWLQLYGALLAVALTTLATILFLARGQPLWWPRARRRWGLFRQLVALGLPVVLLSVLHVVLTTADRFLIIAWLEPAQLGHYGLAVVIMTIALKVPRASREVMEPAILAEAHRCGQREHFATHYGRPLLVTALLLPLLLGGAAFATPALVELVLPEYRAAILPTQVLLGGSFFLGLTYPVRGIAVAAGLQRGLALAMALPVAAGLVLSAGVLAWGYGIVAVAVAKATTFLLLFLTLNAFLWRHYPRLGPDIVRYAGGALALGAVFGAAGGLACALDTGGLGPVAAALARLGLFFALAALPLLWGGRSGLLALPGAGAGHHH